MESFKTSVRNVANSSTFHACTAHQKLHMGEKERGDVDDEDEDATIMYKDKTQATRAIVRLLNILVSKSLFGQFIIIA